jgi:hypothetical protein
MNSSKNGDVEELEEHTLPSGQFKGKCRICENIGHKLFRCKNCSISIHNGGNNGNTTEGIYCTYCSKPGYAKQHSFKLKNKDARYSNNQAGISNNGNHDRENYGSQDVVFATTTKSGKFTDNIWICDSGACGHYCISEKGLFKVENKNESITVDNGKSMMTTMVGRLQCCVIQVDGSDLDITLHEVKYVPELWVNLFSINKLLKNGHKLSNKGLSICLSKGSASVTFDRVIRTTNSSASGDKFSINESPVVCNTISGSISGKKIDIHEFHKILGHCRSEILEKTRGIHD